jgi:hypothetical protein
MPGLIAAVRASLKSFYYGVADALPGELSAGGGVRSAATGMELTSLRLGRRLRRAMSGFAPM